MELALENNVKHVVHASTCDVLEKFKKYTVHTEYTNSTIPYSKKNAREKVALSL